MRLRKELDELQEKEENNGDRIADLTHQRGLGEYRRRKIHPAGQLAAEIGRTYAYQCDIHPLFQSKNQNKYQGKVDDNRIKLLCRADTQKQPAGTLDQQKQGAECKNKMLLPLIFPAAGNAHTEKQAINEYQSIIKHT